MTDEPMPKEIVSVFYFLRRLPPEILLPGDSFSHDEKAFSLFHALSSTPPSSE